MTKVRVRLCICSVWRMVQPWVIDRSVVVVLHLELRKQKWLFSQSLWKPFPFIFPTLSFPPLFSSLLPPLPLLSSPTFFSLCLFPTPPTHPPYPTFLFSFFFLLSFFYYLVTRDVQLNMDENIHRSWLVEIILFSCCNWQLTMG